MRKYVGPVYPGTKERHIFLPIALGGIGLLLQTVFEIEEARVLAATALGMLAVLIYGNMKYSAYFAGTVEEHVEDRSRKTNKDDD